MVHYAVGRQVSVFGCSYEKLLTLHLMAPLQAQEVLAEGP